MSVEKVDIIRATCDDVVKRETIQSIGTTFYVHDVTNRSFRNTGNN